MRILPRDENKSHLMAGSMDLEEELDLSIVFPLIFTALAIILAMLWVKLRSTQDKPPAVEDHQEVVKEKVVETLEEEHIDNEDPVAEDPVAEKQTESVPVEEVGAADEVSEAKESETDTAEYGDKETSPSSQSSQEDEDSKVSPHLHHPTRPSDFYVRGAH